MEFPSSLRPTSVSLRVLDVAMTIAVLFFALGSFVAVVMTPATLGSGGLGVDATVDPRLEAGVRRALSDELPNKIERADVSVNVHVAKDDRDTRSVIGLGLLAGIALGWVGLLSLRGVVRSARDGDPFARRNVNRLRRVGGVIVAFPILVTVINRLLDASFDSELVHPYIGRVGLAPLVVVGIGVLALAEVFRYGTELREFEAAAV